MKTVFQNRRRRGSVLMEFLIVFPIYLVLFGGVFMIGDIAIKSTRLAAADRTRALDMEATSQGNHMISAGWNRIRRLLFPSTAIGEDDVHEENYRYYSNPNFSGPWTVAVGAKVRDEYRLAPWTRGWLAYPDWFISTATGAGQANGNMGALLARSRVAMYAKDVNDARYYNYYTYRRARIYTSGQLKSLYRAMPDNLSEAGRLVDSAAGSASWNTMADEDWPSVGSDNGNGWRGALPGLTGRKYERYRQFREWSD